MWTQASTSPAARAERDEHGASHPRPRRWRPPRGDVPGDRRSAAQAAAGLDLRPSMSSRPQHSRSTSPGQSRLVPWQRPHLAGSSGHPDHIVRRLIAASTVELGVAVGSVLLHPGFVVEGIKRHDQARAITVGLDVDHRQVLIRLLLGAELELAHPGLEAVRGSPRFEAARGDPPLPNQLRPRVVVRSSRATFELGVDPVGIDPSFGCGRLVVWFYLGDEWRDAGRTSARKILVSLSAALLPARTRSGDLTLAFGLVPPPDARPSARKVADTFVIAVLMPIVNSNRGQPRPLNREHLGLATPTLLQPRITSIVAAGIRRAPPSAVRRAARGAGVPKTQLPRRRRGSLAPTRPRSSKPPRKQCRHCCRSACGCGSRVRRRSSACSTLDERVAGKRCQGSKQQPRSTPSALMLGTMSERHSALPRKRR